MQQHALLSLKCVYNDALSAAKTNYGIYSFIPNQTLGVFPVNPSYDIFDFQEQYVDYLGIILFSLLRKPF